MRFFGLNIAIITALLFSGCDQGSSGSSKSKAQPHRVTTETIKLENSQLERRFNALIVAPNTVTISNQIAGTIISMPFRAGAIVKKGDVLVQLDDRLTRAEYTKAQANLEKARQALNRIKKLIPKQLASAEQLSAASTDKKLAEADITLKNIQLERSLIKAPFAGVISQRFAEPGDSLVTNQPLLTLVDNLALIVKSAIPESLISKVAVGKDVKIRIPALSQTMQGKISTIYPTVDNTTQQISIEISLNTITQPLYPGQFAELILSYISSENLLIPVNAVQYDTKGAWVYTVDKDNKALQSRFTAGQNINNKIEVKAGLKPGDIIITRGFVGLRPGKTVSSTPADENTTKQ